MHTHLYHKLTKHFCPMHLWVKDDSAKHAGHAGAKEHGGGHFSIVMVTPSFDGKNRVTRHQEIYALLDDEFNQNKIHALALRLFTPEEWQQSPLKAIVEKKKK